MIFRFVADYSQRPDLRMEFARDPEGVLDRYDIPEAERQHLLAGDREQVARQLHAEIDAMFSGGDYQAVLWPVYYPKITGPSVRQSGPKGKAVQIEISTLNLAREVKVRFHLGSLRTEATILRVDHDPQTRVYTLHAQAVFPENGDWDLEVVNLVEGEERSDLRKSWLTVAGDLSYGLLEAIETARAA